VIVLQWLLSAAAIALMFLLLVAPHEGGHFAFAKLFKVRVIEFSIGMGNRLWSASWGRTLYALRAIPLGGYVRLGGMEPGDFGDPEGFHRKPAYQRILILAGGPLVNFLVAAVVVSGFWMTQLNGDPGRIVQVNPGTPAAAAALHAGDSIQTVNGLPVRDPGDIRRIEAEQPGQPLDLQVRRSGGETERVSVTPTFDSSRRQYLIGIVGAEVVTPVDAVVRGAEFPVMTIAAIGAGMYDLATGRIPGGLLGPEGVTGPVGIGYIANESVRAGPPAYLEILAALSVALGFANLLPIPALDGGRMVTVLIERLRGRPFDRERELAVQRAGLAALLALVAVITFFDIQRISSGQFPGLH
jgi:regulator of sigma E protease